MKMRAILLACVLTLPFHAWSAPVISIGPVSQAALAGTSPYFTVVASGSGTLTYQWRNDLGPVASGSTSMLTLPNVQSGAAGGYAVTVSDGLGETTSGTAILTVVPPAAAVTPALPQIPQRTFLVTAYGAVGNGTTDNTTAIQNALNAAKTAGGGNVRFTAASGSYLSGPLTVSGTTNVQLDYGATLQMLPFYTGTAATPPAGYYPRAAGATSYTHFLTVKSVNDVAFTGQGTIDGQGGPWWTAYTANGTLPSRPRIINVTGANRTFFSNFTMSNSPSFHLAVTSDNLTIFGLTIRALASNALNTDALDPAGNHHLIQNCDISVGDDDIVMKPGGTFCSDITIANCTIGKGHGISIGGQTNKGLNGMIVKDCTFNGTDVGLRMKADATQGGMVQNVTFSNITMTNVPYPILFYSYYSELGSPGATGGSSNIQPAIVNSWNGDSTTLTTSTTNNPKTPNQPINPLNVTTLSGWKNIVVSNLTATNVSGYSVIWGLPLADYLIANVTLQNVKSSGAGLKIYDATNVQITGTTTGSFASYLTCNALAIVGQPQSQTVISGTTITLSAVVTGSSGLAKTPPGLQWRLNGAPLTNGTNTDGSVVSGATTANLTIGNIQFAEMGDYALAATNQLDGYNVTSGTLAGNSLLVSATSSTATVTVITTFASFVRGYGLDPATNGAFTADADGDGIPNGVEFLTGGNPVIASRSKAPTFLRTLLNGSPVFVYQFARSRAAIGQTTPTVQYSVDLENWTNAVAGESGVTVSSQGVDAATDRVTVTIPATGKELFARLVATPGGSF